VQIPAIASQCHLRLLAIQVTIAQPFPKLCQFLINALPTIDALVVGAQSIEMRIKKKKREKKKGISPIFNRTLVYF
jgi:hypothetical protein